MSNSGLGLLMVFAGAYPPNASNCKKMLSDYVEELKVYEKREFTLSNVLYVRTVCPISKAHLQHRLNLSNLVTKALDLLLGIKFEERRSELVKIHQQALKSGCVGMIQTLKKELKEYLEDEQSIGTMLLAKREVNYEAIGWNKKLLEMFQVAHEAIERI
ncbi:hypothetical protein BGW39_001117 [Mortierella sp. 14UC]|nr:hypothetical protein BGW39_001117 [Mortierella sp. 14UC]